LHRRGPSQEDLASLAAAGFTAEDFEKPPVPVWPVNRQAALVFLAMRTQWISGPGGYTGLNYCALAEVWKRLQVPKKDRNDVFADFRIIEFGALGAMYDSKD
jgi:hypothetical protein